MKLHLGRLGVPTAALVSLVVAGALAVLTVGSGAQAPADTDSDGIYDAVDNCTSVSNADQCDSNADGFGNRCDGDFDNDLAVGAADLVELKQSLGAKCGDASYDADLDMDCDCAIGAGDMELLKAGFGLAPGPSGLSCAGSPPCP